MFTNVIIKQTGLLAAFVRDLIARQQQLLACFYRSNCGSRSVAKSVKEEMGSEAQA